MKLRDTVEEDLQTIVERCREHDGVERDPVLGPGLDEASKRSTSGLLLPGSA